MKKLLLMPLFALLLTGCASTNGGSESLKTEDGFDPAPGGSGYPMDPSVDPAPAEPGFDGASSEGGPTTGEEENKNYPRAGQLTCSALDDNDDYTYWLSLSQRGQTAEENGRFLGYKDNFAFNTFNRVNLTINNGKDIKVTIKDDGFTARVDNFHKAYLFPKTMKESYEAEITYLDKNNEKQVISTEIKDNDVIDLEEEFTLSNTLEVMFVIDATGSMGDEIIYLQAEVDNVMKNISTKYPTADLSLAIMMYRDKGDEYITRYSDFTKDIEAQRSFLAKQSADGGGDFEEAVSIALTEAVNKQWSEKSTKLLFHIADAPSHDEEVSSWNDATILAANKGIKMIPVASSGIDKKTEYFFRSEALLTGGQYVYLTNHSGIGGSHIDPELDKELTVEYLNSCLIRLISSYFSGEFIEPVPYQNEN